MTREEVVFIIDRISAWTKMLSMPIHSMLVKLREHDQRQRDELARLQGLLSGPVAPSPNQANRRHHEPRAKGGVGRKG